MNAKEQLQLIKALDEKERARKPSASLAAWGSVVAAAILLALMIAAANRQLKRIEDQRAKAATELTQKQNELDAAQKTLSRLDQAKIQKEDEIRGLQSFLGALPEQQRTALVARTLQQKPQTAALLPRIYLHIVQKEDKAFAEGIGRQLQEAGFLVVGIEYVNLNLNETDVRFYRKVEQPVAEQILAVLTKAGESGAKIRHLSQYENSTTARPNHFEVWLKKR